MKNFKFSFLTILSCILTLTLYTSCKQDNLLAPIDQATPQEEVVTITDDSKSLELPTDVNVINGVLHFSGAQSIWDYSAAFSNASLEELKAWEESIGFSSINTTFLTAMNEIDEKSSIEELNNVQEKYADILIIEDNICNPIINVPFFNNFVNKKGIFYVGSMLYKVTNDAIYQVENGDMASLQNLMATKKSNPDEGTYIIKMEDNVNKSTGACGDFVTASENTLYGNLWTFNITTSIQTFYNPNNDPVNIIVRVRAQFLGLNGVWYNWNAPNIGFRDDKSWVQIDGYINGVNEIVEYYIDMANPEQHNTSEYYYLRTYDWPSFIPQNWDATPYPELSFYKTKLVGYANVSPSIEFTSSICCNFPASQCN